MSIDELMRMVRPPSTPLHTGSKELQTQIEEILAIQSPPDYWEILAAYGRGKFQSSNFELRIYNLYSISPPERCKTVLEMERESLESISELSFGIYPDRPGLFAFGGDVNGNSLYWNTVGDPLDWSVVVCPETGLSGDFEEF